MPKLSVIIPVYNAEMYLRRCLDSVCNQTLDDIEIICVNDASTDNTLEILNEYVKIYPNIKLINCCSNGGESFARNKGLDCASGKYIAFIDNDDSIDLDFYEKLYRKAEVDNADIAKGEVHIIDYDKKESYGNLNKKIRENKGLLFFAYYWWTAIFKASIIKNNNIRFIPDYPLGGDVLFLNQVILLSDSITLVDDAFYHYYRRENSGDSKVLNLEKLHSVLDIHEMIVDNTLQSKRFNKFSQAELNFLFGWCLNATLNYYYRSETTEILDYCVHKAFSIYKKINLYVDTNHLKILPVCLDILENFEENDLKMFFIKNNTSKKMFLANIRFLHTKQSKANE